MTVTHTDHNNIIIKLNIESKRQACSTKCGTNTSNLDCRERLKEVIANILWSVKWHQSGSWARFKRMHQGLSVRCHYWGRVRSISRKHYDNPLQSRAFRTKRRRERYRIAEVNSQIIKNILWISNWMLWSLAHQLQEPKTLRWVPIDLCCSHLCGSFCDYPDIIFTASHVTIVPKSPPVGVGGSSATTKSLFEIHYEGSVKFVDTHSFL